MGSEPRSHRDRDRESSSSKSKSRSSSHRDRDHDDNRSHKRHRRDDGHSSSSHKHRSSSSRKHREDEEEEEDEWVEKESETTTQETTTGKAPVDTVGTFTPGEGSGASGGGLARMEPENLTDGYGEGEVGSSSSRAGGAGMFGVPGSESAKSGAQGEMDFFGSFGIEQKRKEPKEKPDPSQTMGQSSRELNKAYWQGTAPSVVGSSSASSTSSPRPGGSPAPGSSGSGWRMTKLKRTYEAAEDEGRSIEEVALERYGSMEAFEEAREEKRVLDERDSRRGGGGGRRESGRPSTPRGDSARKFVFTDTPDPSTSSRPSSRNAFRRPGETPSQSQTQPSLSRSASTQSLSGSRPSTPIPSVFTPPISRTPLVRSNLSQSTVLNPDPTTTGPTTSDSSSTKPILSQSELNKLQAKVLKAKLMDDESATQLEKEYEMEVKRSQEAGPIVANHEGMAGGSTGATGGGNQVQVLPTLDGRGRMYDTGIGTGVADQWEKERLEKGKRGKKEKTFQSHDPKTGDVIRTSADDDQLSLSDLVRQERFAGGSSSQRDMDYDVANRIATDAKFNTDLDYQDENAERLARRKMKSESMKRQFAINDYARTKKALDSCTLCPPDDGSVPPAPTVALGTRAYLSLMETEELVPGHCRIVPLSHCLSCLEVDEEEGWEEIKNFMKTLMQMFAQEDKGVVFFETITSHKFQKHSYIEAIPVPFDLFDQLPIYFQEAISTSESEWSQHKKLITFSSNRPFRRALVPNLPYFMVQFDYKGENGYGHIIEGIDDAPDRDLDGEEQRGEVGEKGGGEFARYFAQEIIGNLLDLAPRLWRKPKRLDRRDNGKRIEAFRKKYDQYDWTKMLSGFDSEEEGESRTSGSAVGHEEEEAIKQFLRQHSAPCNPDIQINGIPIPPSPLPQEASEMVPLWSPARSNPIKLTRPAATITLCSGSTMPASTLPVPNSLGLSLAPSSNSTTTNSDSVSARKEGRKKVGDNMVRVLSRSGGNAPNGVRDGANKQVETVAVPEAKDTPSVAAESSTPIGVEFPFEDPRFAVIYSLLHSTLLENYKLSLDFDEQSKCLRKALAREGRMKSEANELEKSKDLLPEALSTIVYLEDDLSMCYEEILSLRSKLSRPSLVHSSTQTDFDHDLKPPGTRIPKPPLPESEGSKATIQLAQLRRELDLALDSLASQQVELNNARDSQKRLEAPERARDESEKQVQSTQSFLDEALQECHGWVHKYQVSQKSEEELIQRNQQLEKKLAAIDKSVVQLQARNKGLLGERNEARHWLDSLKRAKAFT
ncbi:uncharacterized protein JCM6883_001353 [Sporobolomyces salmoneus]|uniref:uncharacterized protein n=1 Tax=Sporobolomyces salmoneus TaxID=183962 RepID=UPI00317E6DA7